jgi:RND family efflux transporter MFP subunit
MVRSIVKTVLLGLSMIYFGSVQALALNGFTRFDAESAINSSAAGVVKSVRVSTGQKVKRGDVLVELDATPYRAQLERAQALLKSLQPAMISAELELDRAMELFDRDSLSQVELKYAENKFAAAEGAYQAAQADVNLASYHLKQTQVKSPINARVIGVNTFPGHYVNPEVDSSTLLTIVSANSMQAVAVLNSDQWSSNLINKKATVKYRDKIYQGQVSELGFQRVEQSGGLPAYEIRVVFSTADLIPAEMPVSIDITD